MALELALKAWAGGQLTSPREAFSSLLTPLFGGFLDRNGELDFSTFLTIMHMQIQQEDPKKGNSFGHVDGGQGEERLHHGI